MGKTITISNEAYATLKRLAEENGRSLTKQFDWVMKGEGNE